MDGGTLSPKQTDKNSNYDAMYFILGVNKRFNPKTDGPEKFLVLPIMLIQKSYLHHIITRISI